MDKKIEPKGEEWSLIRAVQHHPEVAFKYMRALDSVYEVLRLIIARNQELKITLAFAEQLEKAKREREDALKIYEDMKEGKLNGK